MILYTNKVEYRKYSDKVTDLKPWPMLARWVLLGPLGKQSCACKIRPQVFSILSRNKKGHSSTDHQAELNANISSALTAE